MNNSAGQVRYDITANSDGFIAGVKQASKALDEWVEKNQEAEADVEKILNNLNESFDNEVVNALRTSLRPVTEYFSETQHQISNFVSGISDSIVSSFKVISGAAATALTSLVKGGMADTQFLENTQIQLQGLTHSIEDGNKAMAYATKYFKNNPFNRFDVTDATKQLIQFGATVEEVPALLDKMGKVSLSTGVEINELARIYQQSSADGKVGLMDIERLASRGVPIWAAFAKATGKSAAQIREETRKGGVAVADFKKAFDYLVDDNAMEQFNNTFSRQVDRFKGRLSNLKASIIGYSVDVENGLTINANGLYKSITALVKKFADTMDSDVGKKLYASLEKLGLALSPIINKIADKIPVLLDKLGDAINFLADNTSLLIPVLGGALTLFGGLAKDVPIVGGAVDILKRAIGFGKNGLAGQFLAMHTPLKLIVALLGAGAFKAIKDGKLNGPLKSIMESVGKIAKALAPVATQLANIFATLGEAVVVPLLESLAKVLEVLANIISSLPTEVLTAFVLAILGFKSIQSVATPIMTFWKSFKTMYAGIQQVFAADFISTVNNIIHGKKLFESSTGFAGSAKNAASEVSTAAQSISTAGQEVTKGQQIMSTMRSGILNMILVAGAIAALGVALKLTNDMLPDDLGPLVNKIALLVGVVTAFGALGWAVGKVDVKPKAILEMAGIAAAIAVLGLAMLVVDKAVPDNIGMLAAKLGIMAGAVAAFGALAFVGGLAPAQIALGLLEMVGVAVAVGALGVAIKIMYDNVPNDIGGVTLKLGIIAEIVVAMGAMAAGIGFVMSLGPVAWFMAAGLAAMIGLVGGIVFIATELKILEKLKLKSKKIQKNVEIVMDTVRMITEDSMSKGIKDLIEAFLQMGIVAAVANIVQNYVDIAKNLNYLQTLKLNPAAIYFNVGLISSVVEFLAPKPGTGVMGKLGEMINAFLQAGIVQAVSNIVETYKTIAGNLNAIQNIELVKDTIKEKIELIAGVIRYISGQGPDNPISALGEMITSFLNSVTTENVGKIVNTYVGIADNLASLQTKLNIGESDKKALEDKISYLQQIVNTLAEGGVGGNLIKGLQTMISSEMYKSSTANANTIAGTFIEVADKLISLKDKIPSDENAQVEIATKLGYVKGIVNNLATAGGSIWNSFQTMISSDNYKNATKNVNEVLTVYPEVFGKIKQLYDTVNEAGKDFDIEKAKKNVNNISEVVKSVLDIKNGGVFQAIGDFFAGGTISVDKIKEIAEIVKHLGTIADRVNNIVDVNPANYGDNGKLSHIKKCIEEIKNYPKMEDADKVKLVNTANAANDALTVLEKVVRHINGIPDIGGENYDKIDHIKAALAKVIAIPGMGDDTKVRLVNTANAAADSVAALQRFVTGVNSLAEIQSDKLNAVLSAVRNLYSRLIEISRQTSIELQNVGFSLMNSLITGINSKLAEIYVVGSNISKAIILGFESNKEDFSRIGRDAQGAIWNAIEPKLRDEYNQGKALAQNLINGFKSKHDGDDTFYKSGKNAVQGFIDGANSKNVYSTGWQIANRFLQGLKDKGKEGSPWKTTYKSGTWAVEGLIDGINDMNYELGVAARNVATTIVDNMSVSNLAETLGYSELSDLSMSISGQGKEGTLGGVQSKSNTINIYNTNYAQSDFNQMGRDIMFNISRL